MMPVRGIACAVLAPLLWGFVPIYIGYLGDADPLEIVVHRALWSGIILLGLVLFVPSLTGGMKAARLALSTSQLRFQFTLTCCLVSLNWVIFVYAVQSRQVFDAALGYFIYPLFTVVLGMMVLGERLDRWAWVAVGIVAVGVALKTINLGGLPWIALLLAGSLGLYGVVRKRMGIDPVIGMFVETVILIPLCVLYLWWRHGTGQPIFFGGGVVNVMLAVFAGVITVVPLLLYHAGNRALPITVSSLLFYINPTTQLLIGLIYFGLSVASLEWAVFGLIWTGLVVYFSTRPRAASLFDHPR